MVVDAVSEDHYIDYWLATAHLGLPPHMTLMSACKDMERWVWLLDISTGDGKHVVLEDRIDSFPSKELRAKLLVLA